MVTSRPARSRAPGRWPRRGWPPAAWRRSPTRGSRPSSAPGPGRRRSRRCPRPARCAPGRPAPGRSAAGTAVRGRGRVEVTEQPPGNPGPMTTWPAATDRIAAHHLVLEGALEQVARAPARIADSTVSSSSNIVRTRTAAPGTTRQLPGRLDPVHVRHVDVHDDDVRLGQLRLAHGLSPVVASATTTKVSSEASRAPMPRRTTKWSSAMSTRIGAAVMCRAWPLIRRPRIVAASRKAGQIPARPGITPHASRAASGACCSRCQAPPRKERRPWVQRPVRGSQSGTRLVS